jgi:cell division protein FtsI (penicillin-binding protein 3)
MIRSKRIGMAHATLALFALAILGRAAHVQLLHGSAWRGRAERQQSRDRVVPAPRGDILDGARRVMAQSRDMVQLDVAPHEVNDRAALRRALTALNVDGRVIANALDSTVKWVTIPGRFLAVDAAPAITLRGVYTTAALVRSYAATDGTRRLVGRVDGENKAVDGLELALDSILRGTPGRATMLLDSKGQMRESPIAPGSAPTKGNTVILTLNSDLQEIAENALGDAVARMGAEGGDIVILDPHDGEILALASRRTDPRQTSATTITEPFEPGSTLKPFIAAGLLSRGRVGDADSVDTGNGVLEINGREIHDEHHLGRAPLSEVLRWSSNIGIVKFGERLSAGEEYETLRDFGFGTATGVPYPTESGGTLRAPRFWSKQSANSMAMGYELAVTPLQLAAAYATFANGGELLEPALVKEVVGPDGRVRFRHQRRVVRRVMPTNVADTIRHMLLDVVDEGTALQAALSNYVLAGKTGTPRGTVAGRYVTGRYNPNFVGLFPGDAPQYVIVVKLSAPKGTFYGGTTAAPLTKAILQAAIAARDAALDRTKLASSVVPTRIAGARKDSMRLLTVAQSGARRGSADETLPVQTDDTENRDAGAVPYVVTLPAPHETARPAEAARRVPNIRGLSLRDAVRSLHSAGFRVQLIREPGAGTAVTAPAAGELAPAGGLVRLLYAY